MDNNENYETVDIDLSDEDFMILARKAHEKNITLNDLMCQILQEYVDGKLVLDNPENHTSAEELNLRRSVVDIINEGITVKTLSGFAFAYGTWFDNAPGDTKTLGEIIQDGFDVANEKENTSA